MWKYNRKIANFKATITESDRPCTQKIHQEKAKRKERQVFLRTHCEAFAHFAVMLFLILKLTEEQ